MLRISNCTSCGAKVIFRASSSLLAVCEYCKTTLIRNDLALKSLGKMADLLPDQSSLQLGTRGRYKGDRFTIIGRVQYQYSEGIWNEWHVLFDSGRTGWLSEASGSSVLSFAVPDHALTDSFSQYKINAPVLVARQQFRVVATETARCIAGEGELPFNVLTGFNANIVDMANETAFASLDFSAIPPLLFIGEQVDLPDLRLTNLRNVESTRMVSANSFNCPSCAAPLSINIASIKSIVCSSCTAVLSVDNANATILKKFQLASNIKPRIALGSIGHFHGADYTAIGFMRRQTTTRLPYSWNEYLLHHPTHGFRWLTESNGHWSLVKALQKSPTISRNWTNGMTEAFLLKKHKHFQQTSAKVTYVIGEFYWRVSFDNVAVIHDYVAPPSILSEEKIGKEVTWSLGDYMTPAEIETAFHLTEPLPEPRDIAPNQPSPYQRSASALANTMFVFLILGFLIQLGFVMFSANRPVMESYANFEHGYGEKTFQSIPFEITGRPANIVITQTANIENDWLATEVTVIEKNSGKAYHATRDRSFYSGYDGGEYWSEGSKTNEIIFSDVPAGNYYLRVEADTEISSVKSPINDFIRVYRDVPQWSNLLVLWAVLLIIPGIFFYLRHRYEVKRWAESDHPMLVEE